MVPEGSERTSTYTGSMLASGTEWLLLICWDSRWSHGRTQISYSMCNRDSKHHLNNHKAIRPAVKHCRNRQRWGFHSSPGTRIWPERRLCWNIDAPMIFRKEAEGGLCLASGQNQQSPDRKLKACYCGVSYWIITESLCCRPSESSEYNHENRSYVE